MPSRAKTAKGKSKRKGRGRKTTDWFDAPVPTQTSSGPAATNTSNRHQVLTVTGGNGNDTFTLTLGTETSSAIDHDASRKVVQDAIKGFEKVKIVKCKGGDLDSAPVTIDFKSTDFDIVPLMTATGTGCVATVTPNSDGDEKEWSWTGAATWQDANSGRKIMEIPTNGMKFFADETGAWRLIYKRTLSAFDHRWVYKLKAYSDDDELLVRLTVPAVGGVNVIKPGVTQADHFVASEGVSENLAGLLPAIDKWVRVGVGEYWD